LQEDKHLKQFNLTWQLHDKHLFHSIIYSDPVVQNCMPKVVAHIRSVLHVFTVSSVSSPAVWSSCWMWRSCLWLIDFYTVICTGTILRGGTICLSVCPV